jgi:hypothetical protein
MICRVGLSIAGQNHCVLAFFATKLPTCPVSRWVFPVKHTMGS